MHLLDNPTAGQKRIAAVDLSPGSLFSIEMSFAILALLREQKKNVQREICLAGRTFEEQVRSGL